MADRRDPTRCLWFTLPAILTTVSLTVASPAFSKPLVDGQPIKYTYQAPTIHLGCPGSLAACDECYDFPESASACSACLTSACDCDGEKCFVARSEEPKQESQRGPTGTPGGEECGTCTDIFIQRACTQCSFDAASGQLSLPFTHELANVDRIALMISRDGVSEAFPIWNGDASAAPSLLSYVVKDSAGAGTAELLYRTTVRGKVVWVKESIESR